MAVEKVVIAELQIDTGNVIEEQEELGKQILETTKKLQAARKENTQYTAENIKAAAKLKTLKTSYSANQRVLQGLTATQTGQVKTIKEARAVVSALNVEWQKSAQVNGENDERTKNLAQKMSVLNKQINENKLAVGDSTSNIGKYNGKLSESIQAAGGLPGPLAKISTTLKSLGKAILLNPLFLLVAAIAAAGKAIQTFFTNSEEGQDRWNVTVSKGKVILGNFKDGLSDAGKAILDFKDNIKDSEGGLKEWGKALTGSIRKDWKKFKDDVADNGFWDTVKNNVQTSIDGTKEIIKSANDALQKQFKTAENLANRQNQLNKDERKALVERAKLQTEIAELILKTRDRENVSNEESLQAIKEAQILRQEEFDEEVRLAAERLKLKQIENSLSQSTREDLEAEAQLEADLIRLEKTRSDQIRELKNREIEITNRINAEERTRQVELKAEAAERIKTLKEEMEAEREALDAKRQAELIDEENRLIAIEDGLDREFELRQFDLDRKHEAEVAAAEKTGADVELINKKFAKADIELAKLKENAKLSMASSFVGNISTLFGKQTKVGQAAALAQTAINTYLGAQAAFAQTPGGIGIKLLAAGAATATGLRNIAKIKAVNTNVSSGGGGGGVSGGGSIATPSTGANIPSPQGATAATNFSSSIVTSGSQQAAQAQNMQTQALNAALEANPNVLVLEDFETTKGRNVSVVNESEQ